MNILEFNNIVHSVVSNDPIDSETTVIILSISRLYWLSFQKYSKS